MKISANNPTDFRKIIRYLIHTQRKFHSFKDPSNKKFSVVFKNLHQSITEPEILQDLQQRYASIIRVTRLLKDGHPIPVVAAEFNGSEPIETILSIKQICNHRVSTERRKKHNGPLQCQRCLDYGHTKNNCNHSITCAFCAGNHYSVLCPKKGETPFCENCSGNHEADIRNTSCTYYKEFLDRKSNLRNKNKSNVTNSNDPPPSKNNSRDPFPGLPQTQRIQNFTHITSMNNPPPRTSQNTRNSNHQTAHSNDTQPNNPIITTIINSITSCIINFINSLIPSIISTIQNSVTDYLSNNNGR